MLGVWIRSYMVRKANSGFSEQIADGSQRDGWEDGVVHAFEPSYSYLEGTLTFNEWSVSRRASLSVCGQTLVSPLFREVSEVFRYSLIATP